MPKREFIVTFDSEEGDENRIDDLSKQRGYQVKETGFTDINRQEFVNYTPELFLEHAQKYLDESPPNLVQACEKVWGACSYSLQIYFLRMGFNLKSHDAMKFLVSLIANKGCKQEGANMWNAWRAGEKCHKHFNGNYPMSLGDFKDKRELVKFFVNCFDEEKIIDHGKVKEEMTKMIKKIAEEGSVMKKIGKFEVTLKMRSVKKMEEKKRAIGGKTYICTHEFY